MGITGNIFPILGIDNNQKIPQEKKLEGSICWFQSILTID